MKQKFGFLFSVLIFLVLMGCVVQVKTYQKPSIDFTSYASWCWMQGCEITYQGPDYYYDKRVIDEMANAIAWNMHDKGYMQGDDESDLVVNFYTIMEQDSAEVSTLYYGTHQDEREWLPMLYPEYQQFMKGSLIIDVIERESSELVWRSNAIRYLEVNPSYDKKAIWNGVAKAMKRFPIRQP